MKKCWLLILVSMVALLLSALPVLASDVNNAQYQTAITITNNGSAAISNGITTFNLPTAQMITAGMLSANALDCAMKDAAGNDVAFAPSINSTIPGLTFVPYIGANSNLNEYLYSKGATDGKLCYFPADAGMTVTDNDSLKLGDNFTIDSKGWINTTANGTAKKIIYKPAAFITCASPVVSGNITSGIFQNVPPTSGNGAADWVDVAKAYDNNTATYAYALNTGWTGYITFTRTSLLTESIRYYVSSVASDQINIDAYYNGQWNDVYQGSLDTGDWEARALASIADVSQIRLQLYYAGLTTHQLAEIQIGGFTPSVSVTGIATGERRVLTTANTTYLNLMVYDANGVSLGSSTTNLNYPSPISDNLILTYPILGGCY